MGYIIFKRLVGIPNVALLVRPMVHKILFDFREESSLAHINFSNIFDKATWK